MFNYCLLYFLLELSQDDATAWAALLQWMDDMCRMLGARYAYLNPSIYYDWLSPNLRRHDILALLKAHPTVDFFEDFNQMRLYADRVKGPMWRSVITTEHLRKISTGRLPVLPVARFSVTG